MQQISNYIDGKLVAPVSEIYLDDSDPATGEVYAHIPDSDERDVERAVAAAKRAFPEWAATPADARARLLLRIAERIEARLDDLAMAECLDTGKPLHLARSVDIPRAASNFRFFAGGAMHFFSEAHVMEDTALNYTLRQPVGVAGCISPWNLPLYLFTWKIAPALATGNCVVGKPSEITPMTAFRLCEICQEVGLPDGVLNVVHGTGPKVGAALVAHPEVAAVSFTGGSRTGEEIARITAPLFKKVSLEMGGKNPNIVFADCDYEEAMAASLRAAFSNQGQICLCGSRLFIERSLYARFRDEFVARARRLRVGDPLQENSDLGAVVSQAHMQKVLSYIELARQEGGTILCGGNQVTLAGRCAGGWFVQATVIQGLPPECRTNQEEIFGPVVTLLPFDSEEEVVAYANSTDYGLAATIWTRDLSRAHRLAAQLQSGIIWVNCWMLRDLRTPFGGLKRSGVGREGGFEAMRFFTEAKNVCIKL